MLKINKFILSFFTGEHKVMEMIRKFGADEGSDYKVGSRRHCMYGLDADLIM